MKRLVILGLVLLSLFAQAQEAAIYLAAPNQIIFCCSAVGGPFQVSYKENGVIFDTWYDIYDREVIPVSCGSCYELFFVKDNLGREVTIDQYHKCVNSVYSSGIELKFPLPPEIEEGNSINLSALFSTNPPVSQFFGSTVSFSGNGVSGSYFDPCGLGGTTVAITANFSWAGSILSCTRFIFVKPHNIEVKLVLESYTYTYCQYENIPLSYWCSNMALPHFFRLDGRPCGNMIAPGVGSHYVEVVVSYNGIEYVDGSYVYVNAQPSVTLYLPPQVQLGSTTILTGGWPLGGRYDGECVYQCGENFLFSPSHPGTYEVKYTYTSLEGCTGVASGTIFVVCSGFGVDEDEVIRVGVEVYPNPASDKLTIETQEPIGTLEIYNLMGVMVYSQSGCTNKVEIDISVLPSGVYFVRGISIKKFVKQ